MAHQGDEFWVGELDDKIVTMGAFKLSNDGAGAAELKRMRVLPEVQGQGIGSALLRLLENRARNCGYSSLILDTVEVTQAQKFYEHHGYHETHRQIRTSLLSKGVVVNTTTKVRLPLDPKGVDGVC